MSVADARIEGPGDEAAEAVRRPGTVQLVLPFVATALLLGWLFQGMDWAAVWEALRPVPAGTALAAALLQCGAFFAMDVAAFGAAYRADLSSAATWRQIAVLRGGMLPLQVVLPPLAEVLPPAYFHRRWGVGPLRTLGAALRVLACDMTANLTLLSVGLAWAGSRLGSTGMGLVALGWLAVAVAVVRLAVARQASRLALHARVVAARLLLGLCNALCVWLLLRAMQVPMPAGQALVLGPLVMFGAFLPISAGGYGGPQGAAILWLVTVQQQTSEPTALAFSLLWSTLFALSRFVLGLGFVAPAWRLLRER